MRYTILLVEDDTTLNELLAFRLRSEGYSVITVEDGVSALAAAAKVHPHLVLLDLLLPKLDGLEVCKQLRAQPATQHTPIVILTARAEIDDRILGLELGADDYITKPFSWAELRIRIRTQLHRLDYLAPVLFGDGVQLGMLHVDELTIDLDRRRLWRAEEEITLGARLFDLLVYFARHCDRVITRAQLIEKIWEHTYDGDTRTVDVHVRWLREKIERDPSNPVFIQTVRGVGYRFTCVTTCSPTAAAR
jgi:DNA-binding response OmpR family regulator